MNRPPLSMTPEEIISEIGTLRQELDVRLARIHGLAKGLYHQVRMAPADDNTAVYITYAHAWTRFAGMANQGVQRTVSASKVLRQLTPKENAAVVPAAKGRQLRPVVAQDQSPMDSLIEMYRDPIENEGALVGSASDEATDAASDSN
jgi:hypothetical protein